MAQDAFAGTTALAADELALRVTEQYERRGRELRGLARRLGALFAVRAGPFMST